jgi:hypothetical protein
MTHVAGRTLRHERSVVIGVPCRRGMSLGWEAFGNAGVKQRSLGFRQRRIPVVVACAARERPFALPPGQDLPPPASS